MLNNRSENLHTGEMPWDKPWDFEHYKLSGVTRRTIKLVEIDDIHPPAKPAPKEGE